MRDRTARKIWICQDIYINKIVLKYNLQDRKNPDIPMSTDDLIAYEGTAMLQERVAY
jgi:hypothetical protein